MSDIERRRQAVHVALVELMQALDEWKDAGGHVSRVSGALHDFVNAALMHAYVAQKGADR